MCYAYPLRWRYWLLDAPARITEVLWAWYRLYFVVLIVLAAVIPTTAAITALLLWSVFGIRWGW